MKQILIIDDNIYNYKDCINKVFDEGKYCTRSCSSLAKAEEYLGRYVFDVIVIDIMMPCPTLKNRDELKAGLNFYEEKMKQIDGIEETKILFWSNLSSHTFDEFFKDGKPNNVYFLHKDIDNENHLHEKIVELLNPKPKHITREELGELLTEAGYEDSLVFENPSYLGAVIGWSDTGQVCYDFEKMIEWLMEEDSSITYEDAIDFISYNTERALPYEPSDRRPIIIYPLQW